MDIAALLAGDHGSASMLQAYEAKYNKLRARYAELEQTSNEGIKELQGQLEPAQARIEQLEKALAKAQAAAEAKRCGQLARPIDLGL